MPQKLWRALLLLAVVLAFGVSFGLLRQVIGNQSPWLVLLLMFYVLAGFKMAEPLFLLRMPPALRALRPCEIQGAAYRRWGVAAFGRVLRRSPLRYLNAAVYLGHGRYDPGRTIRYAEASEASHCVTGLLVLPYIVYVALQERWSVAAGFVIAELLVNGYPVLHLRYTRGRLERVTRRTQGTSRSGPRSDDSGRGEYDPSDPHP